MRLDYIDLPFEFYGTGRGRRYECKGALRDIELPHLPPSLVPKPLRLVTFHAKIDSTSQTG